VVDAVARSAADLMFIQKDQFEAALSDHPGAMRDVLGALSAQLQELLNITAGMRSGSAKARLAGLLVTLAGDKPLPVKLTLTQQELGELLGLTRATINAALGDFEHRALVQRSYGRLDVLDLDGLRLAALGPE
jgi:CRP-like cAMP-binding protein